MRLKFLLCSVILLLVIESILACRCLRNGGICNCVPRQRLWLRAIQRNPKIVAVIQNQEHIIQPNICECGRPLVNPYGYNDYQQGYDQSPIEAKCLCIKKVENVDCPHQYTPWGRQFYPKRQLFLQKVDLLKEKHCESEILPPQDLSYEENYSAPFDGADDWIDEKIVKDRRIISFIRQLVQRKITLDINVINYLKQLVRDKLIKDENIIRYFKRLVDQKIEKDGNVIYCLKGLFETGAKKTFGSLWRYKY